MKVTGNKGECMEMELFTGKMGGNMKENMKWMSNLVMEYFIGKMEDSMTENGEMENNME
eukprot:CAMPEP_0205808198 /NCGR_PEP_ID=MMETSP0205-20121125/12080_1 /ASSEMBLY_ACC=CAM_ASM_000278 /TAXON_ID=36767 /ORGANISM="Euplotes focardii, Strain TN1" /LENGTH=58 /DNA_ID=CAMNT_0053083493 /DNA_START=94 /DNA_END=267 /DNA_ORIENTATION=+